MWWFFSSRDAGYFLNCTSSSSAAYLFILFHFILFYCGKIEFNEHFQNRHQCHRHQSLLSLTTAPDGCFHNCDSEPKNCTPILITIIIFMPSIVFIIWEWNYVYVYKKMRVYKVISRRIIKHLKMILENLLWWCLLGFISSLPFFTTVSNWRQKRKIIKMKRERKVLKFFSEYFIVGL